MLVTYDATRLAADVSTFGLTPQQLTLNEESRAAFAALTSQESQELVGFLRFAELDACNQQALALAQQLAGTFTQVVVIGIGGSDLGTRAVYQALKHLSNPEIELLFTGNTTDPDAVAEVLERFRPEEALLVFISKSGVTLEVTSAFMLFLETMRGVIGSEAASKRVIAITDPEKGALRRMATEQGWYTAAVPSLLGGRFSVFSPVGILPLALVGIDCDALLAGAQEYRSQDREQPETSIALAMAQHQVACYRKGQVISVLMTYSSSLAEVTAWFRQLWAESLGKRHHRDGSGRPVGPFPVSAVGPTDQHSQLQRWTEGPDDTVFTFLSTETPRNDFRVPDAFPGDADVAYMVGHSLHEIRTIQLNATADALAASGKPSATLMVQTITPESIGGLLMHFMLATAYAAEMLALNAYDQPGVEHGKVLTKQRLFELNH
jgi:glucose-6-phosphate isomerase